MIRAAAIALLLPIGAAAEAPGPVVVELFTSQGCSSCPPADRLLSKLAERDDVIALALHVDYWDYIGWEDRFADPAYTKRQRAYARARGERMIYTPQMVIGGTQNVVGTRPDEVLAALDAVASAGPALSARREGERIRIEAPALEVPQPLVVHLVRLDPAETVAISRGENAGRVIDYTNIVTSWEALGVWDGTAPLALETALMGDEPCVVLLQEPGPGAIHAAVKVN